MQSKFSDAILEMQQKSGLKYLILEKKIAAMKEELEVKEAQLHAVVEGIAPKKGIRLVVYHMRKMKLKSQLGGNLLIVKKIYQFLENHFTFQTN